MEQTSLFVGLWVSAVFDAVERSLYAKGSRLKDIDVSVFTGTVSGGIPASKRSMTAHHRLVGMRNLHKD